MAGENTPQVSWRLLEFVRAPGVWQMAADLYFYRIIEQHPQPIIVRFYSFDPPAITIGFHQTLDRAIDRQACVAAGIDVVRRPTGGRALLHRNELNYAVIADTTRTRVFGSGLAEGFRRISFAVAGGLDRLGLEVRISGSRFSSRDGSMAPGGGICATSTTRHEITCQAQKVVAAAQLRSAGKLLQHGTIYVDEPSPTPPEFFVQAKSINGPGMADLHTLLGRRLGDTAILRAIREGFIGVFGPDYSQESYRPAERRDIARLASDTDKSASGTD